MIFTLILPLPYHCIKLLSELSEKMYWKVVFLLQLNAAEMMPVHVPVMLKIPCFAKVMSK